VRRFLEFKGHSFRHGYDRERADFVIKVEPHPFVVRKPANEIEATHNGNGTEPARRHRCRASLQAPVTRHPTSLSSTNGQLQRYAGSNGRE